LIDGGILAEISVEYNILKREVFPKGKMIVNEIRQQERG
jgi:hypothetical protein